MGLYTFTIDSDTIHNSGYDPSISKKEYIFKDLEKHILTDFYVDPCPMCILLYDQLHVTFYFHSYNKKGNFTVVWKM